MVYDPKIEEYAHLFYQQVEGQALPSVGDGVTYSRALGWQSPEGNFYGQERWVRDWPVGVVWDGESYRALEVDGEADSFDELPVPGNINPRTGLPYGTRTHFEIWAVPRLNWPPTDLKVYDGRDKEFYFWDSISEAWLLIEWFWNIDSEIELPIPGVKIGAAHILYYYDVKVMWNGLAWVRYSHEMIDIGDNDTLHLPEGFITNYESFISNTNGAIQTLSEDTNEQFQDVAEQIGLTTEEFRSRVCEARLEFTSKTHLSLYPSILGNIGALWVTGELLLTDNVTDVQNTDPVLQYSAGAITEDTVEASTEYYVYCGNSDFTNASSKLFLSQTPDVNGHLGTEATGLNARIVGVVETDSAGYFVREIDMSYIGKKVEFSQTYWEYSDFQLQFVDQDTLEFTRIDGTHGLCYINGQLLNLGTGKELLRDAYRIEWSNGPVLDTDDIAANTTYQVYIANDSYEYNFNSDGEDGLPLDEGDDGYIEQLDFRRSLFLSTKEHDHRLFDQEYPGYYARHIGQVQTDANGCFKYSADISLIRQPTLNPTSLDGLAECVIQDVSTTQFKVIRKKGTTGIVYVGGKPVQTYDSDNPLVHVVTTSDALYEYDETEIDAPLTDSGDNVADKPGVSIYLYLANDIAAWGGVSTFCSMSAPVSGYLSANWPGNQARWLATLQLSPDSLGSEKVANGTFESDTSWTKGTGWSYSSGNKNMVHTPGNTAALSQNVSVTAGNLYACTFYITGRTAGIAAPKIGGVSGQSISGNTSSTQYLLATTTGNLEIVPDTYFDGSVDNVSVKQVTSGKFSGTYIKDSVSGVSAQIDDSIVSTSTTYSSNKIEQIRQQLLGKIALALGLNGSHTAGLDLVLEYVNSTTVKLKANSTDVDVVFPNLETVTVTTAGITKTVTGSTSTLYYIYLVTDGTLTLLTDAPTDVYSSISFYGETHVLVGWLAFASTNTLDGTHNVYSFWNEPTRTYTQSTTSLPSTLSLSGCVLAPNKTATIGWSGSVTGRSYYHPSGYIPQISWSLDTTSTTIETTTNASNSWEVGGEGEYYYPWVNRAQTMYLSVKSFTTSITNVSSQLTISVDFTHNYDSYLQSNTILSCTGTITLTRPGS